MWQEALFDCLCMGKCLSLQRFYSAQLSDPLFSFTHTFMIHKESITVPWQSLKGDFSWLISGTKVRDGPIDFCGRKLWACSLMCAEVTEQGRVPPLCPCPHCLSCNECALWCELYCSPLSPMCVAGVCLVEAGWFWLMATDSCRLMMLGKVCCCSSTWWPDWRCFSWSNGAQL